MPSLFAHYSEYSGPWPWGDFSPREVSCRHCGELYLGEADMAETPTMPVAVDTLDAPGMPAATNSPDATGLARAVGSAFEPLKAAQSTKDMAGIAPELWALQRLRALLGSPIVLNSAHRCVRHNAAVGGASASRHLGLAFDCRCPAASQERFCRLARQAGFTGIGRYPERGFVHLDLGPARAWWG